MLRRHHAYNYKSYSGQAGALINFCEETYAAVYKKVLSKKYSNQILIGLNNVTEDFPIELQFCKSKQCASSKSHFQP